MQAQTNKVLPTRIVLKILHEKGPMNRQLLFRHSFGQGIATKQYQKKLLRQLVRNKWVQVVKPEKAVSDDVYKRKQLFIYQVSKKCPQSVISTLPELKPVERGL